ncbi:MAG: hypothetical protein MUF06_19855 [Pirellulaceae bacterium]|jgi:hypothetical protein|nr:hypothetical protein [Pirellulaceae bacterium]
MLRTVAKNGLALPLVCWVLMAAPAVAQGIAPAGPWHYQHKASLPPGAIGLRQLERGGPLGGYFQPVEVRGPEGSLISLAVEGTYTEPEKNSALAGMLIGHVYRLKVGNIPNHEGAEVFPTIEVIDRLYPPPGQAARFPIPVVLTQEELEMALDGRYVLRVIYVENPRTAVPVADVPGDQRYFEIPPGQDAMETADKLGRPIAILRMGSRVPMADEVDGSFAYQHPPLQILTKPEVLPRRQDGLEEPLEAPPQLGRPSRNFPRLR